MLLQRPKIDRDRHRVANSLREKWLHLFSCWLGLFSFNSKTTVRFFKSLTCFLAVLVFQNTLLSYIFEDEFSAQNSTLFLLIKYHDPSKQPRKLATPRKLASDDVGSMMLKTGKWLPCCREETKEILYRFCVCKH